MDMIADKSAKVLETNDVTWYRSLRLKMCMHSAKTKINKIATELAAASKIRLKWSPKSTKKNASALTETWLSNMLSKYKHRSMPWAVQPRTQHLQQRKKQVEGI